MTPTGRGAGRRKTSRKPPLGSRATRSGLGEAVLDALPLSLYVVDRRLRIVVWNRAREEGPIGRARNTVLGRPLKSILPESGFRATAPLIEQVFESGEIREDTKETRDGRRLLRVRRVPVKQGGRVTHVLSWFEDVTEQRALEMRLIASDRLAFLGQLVAGVAHEVANPLASIAGCAEALASLAIAGQSGRGRREAQDFRNLILEEIARCERIVRTLLGSARSHADSSTDVVQTVDTVMWLLARHPAFTRVRVKRQMPAELPPVQIDGDSLKQVVLALSMNAARAMRAGGTLTIRAARSGRDRVRLDILDTGIGIPPAIRGRIFEPFFTTDASQGTGLGLAIARSLVHGRGGDLIYSPRRQGSAFRIVLNAGKAAATNGTPPARANGSPRPPQGRK